MRKLQALLKWALGHVYVKRRNLNDDEEGKPVPAVEAGVRIEF